MRPASPTFLAQALVILASAMLAPAAPGQSPPAPPAPPSNLQAVDHPWDDGTSIDLAWTLSADDTPNIAPARVTGYVIRSRKDGASETIEVARTGPGETSIKIGDLEHGESYTFDIAAVGTGGAQSTAVAAAPIEPRRQIFNASRLPLMALLAVICGAIIAYIILARGGMKIHVRKIAGLQAVEEAVGRATEMGRPVLFVPGIQDMNEIMTIAGLIALGRVAKVAAEYDATLEVPTARSLVMAAARETVHAAFLAAGRPDSYNEELIYYVTDEQFGYVAYLTGHMVRAKPAACFYLGAFYAESLILAETGNAIGAIQIAGTAETAQLPFFVAACDYTLIGEEFYAASAYLSGEPDQLGSLKGQDVGKVIVIAFMIVGTIVATGAELTNPGSIFSRAYEFIMHTVLS